jgi:ubiquinone/menaquinone biosynthesis C-methylase UbiE
MAKMKFLEKSLINSYADYIFHKYFVIGKHFKDLHIPGNKKVLEIGCGVGITTELLMPKVPDSEYTSLDYDIEQVKLARQNSKISDVKIVQGDATNFEYEDNTFDVIFEIFTFHHIVDFKKALQETYRILKKGGRFYLIDMPTKSDYLYLKLWQGQPADFSREEFTKAFKDAGFKITNESGSMFFSLTGEK